MNAGTDNLDRQILDLLQREFPLSSHPFAVLGQKLGIPEEETLRRAEALYQNGIIRQISAIFDTRSLGYDSCLVAMKIPTENLDAAAAVVNGHPGVSHNYSRTHPFNLWFTIATPPGHDLASDVRGLGDKAGATATLILPVLRMFKIGVKLDVTGTKDPLSLEKENHPAKASRHKDPPSPLTEFEIATIRELQENLLIESTPFRPMAERLGITEEGLLAVARRFIEQGRMRRFAAVLRHREAGFKANAMGVWIVPPRDADRVGTQLASFQAVSHCYERPAHLPLWPYNIFTMVHARTTEECLNILQNMSERVGIKEYDYLFSTKEYKKTRVRYFV